MWPFRRRPSLIFDPVEHSGILLAAHVRLTEAQRFSREMERWPAPLTAWQNAQLGPLLPIVVRPALAQPPAGHWRP